MIEVKVGEFVQKHIKKIIKACIDDPKLLKKLSDVEYSKEEFGIQWKELSFLRKSSEITQQYDDRFWKKKYPIENESYRFFSQYGGSKQLNGKNYSKFHGEKVLNYFKKSGLLLDEYIGQDIKFIVGNKKSETSPKKSIPEIQNTLSLNQILYGPPGTGKTYSTINRALEIIDGEVPEERNEAKKRFEELSSAGQIEFVTFHQSYGYEEFVEGIKASTTDGSISYDVEPGVFKKLAGKANTNFNDSKKSSKQIREELTIKEKIELFLNESIENETKFVKTKGGEFRIKDLLNDNIYIYSDSSNYNDNSLILSIEEFYKVMLAEIELRTSKQLAREVFQIPNQRQKDTYYLALYKAIKEFKSDELDIKKDVVEDLKNYILIIDEINRGNISKIFGELITLIEPSKRLGAEEEIRLRLPYSNEFFGVPSNLYIIGTMNTADRSIALMDTALRRRFEFVEMMPQADLLDFEVAGVNLRKLLKKINARVEYLYDRDHAIGHAYFMELHVDSTLAELNAVMRNKIIPLLQEYFYDDWEKILLVLNEGFVERVELDSREIFGRNIDNDYDEDKVFYTIVKEFKPESYLSLCQNR